jgi:membrane-associated phospholipid phosphatase
VPRRPLDLLNFLVVLIMLAIALYGAIAGRLAAPTMIFLRLAAVIVALLVVVSIEQHRRGWWVDLLVNFYPIPLVPIVFDTLQPLINVVGFPNQDDALIAIDRWMLGGYDAAVVLRPIIRPWLSDLLHIAYCTYFLFPIVVGIAAWWRSRRLGQQFIFTIVLAFYISYAGYFFVPAVGPRYAQWPESNQETHHTPISHAIYYGLNAVENTTNDVFPSGHVMITAVCLLAVVRFHRGLFWILLPIGLGLCFATVYCRYHYVIDVIAGLVLAAFALPFGYWIFNQWGTSAESAKG